MLSLKLQITQTTMKRSLLGTNKKDKIKTEVIGQGTQIKGVIYIV